MSSEKPIVFLTSGTRGDVQPIIPLARGLQDRGCAVRIAAPPAFCDFVRAHGIPFVAMEGNPSDLMIAKGGQIALTFDGNWIHSARSSIQYLQAARSVYAQMLANAWPACEDARALVIGLPTLWGTSIAEKLDIPCIGAFLQPLTPTHEFPCPALPLTRSLGEEYNYITYFLLGLLTYLPWRKVINGWRKCTLGLNPLPILGPSPQPFGRIDLNLYGFSEHVLARPKDWMPSSLITGYWPLNSSNEALPAPLMDFIRSGPPPVYFGFGSPGTYQPDHIFETILQASLRTETRAVISLPQGTHMTETPPQVHVLRESVSHPALFPLMQGAVHHGGAGTTGTALLAGIPSLVTPVAVDQFFWGKRVSALGVGPKPIPQRALSVENLVEGLEKMKEERMKERARDLGEKLRREDGTGLAVQEIVRLLA